MTRIAMLATASCIAAVLSAPTGEKHSDPLAALEKKLHGNWDGNGPCDGRLVLNHDRTYKREFYGPNGNNSAGTWSLHWDALPPTLTLHCKTSDDPGHVNKAFHWKVLQLDDAALAMKYEREPKPLIYSRTRNQMPLHKLITRE